MNQSLRNRDSWVAYFHLIWKGKWIILFCLAVGMGHGFYQLVTTPRFYETEIRLMLLEEGASTGGGIANLLQLGQESTVQDTILNILQSRRMAEDIAQHFEFGKRYNLDKSSAMKKAMGMIYASTFRRLIAIKVNAEDQQMAIDLAYFCAENLQRFNEQFAISGRKMLALQMLDPPELFLMLGSRQQQKRLLIMESLLGLFVGFGVVFARHYLPNFRKILVDTA